MANKNSMQKRLIESEKRTERVLFEEVKKLGGLCLKLVPMFMSGLPDRLVLMPGAKIYFVETKSTGDTARKLQLYVHKMIINLGFSVYIIDTRSKLDEFLKMITK